MNEKEFLNYPFVLDTHTAHAGTPVYLDVETAGFENNYNFVVRGGSGDIYNNMAFMRSGQPMIRIASPDVKNILDNIPQTGLLIDAGASGDGVDLYYQKAQQGGARATGAVHHQTTIAKGMCILNNISIPADGDARASFDAYGVSADGIASPYILAETASLPAAVYPSLDTIFGMGKVDLNGITVDGKMSVDIAMGITVRVNLLSDGDTYPVLVYIVTQQPVITIRSFDLGLTATLTEAGVEYAENLVTIYGRKRDEGGGYVIDGTAEHLKITLGKCHVHQMNIDGEPQKQQTIQIVPWDKPGAAPVRPMTISTASAIT